MKSSVTKSSIKKAKKQLIEFFKMVGIRETESDEIALDKTDIQQVRTLAQRIAYWASTNESFRELESMMRVCNSSLADSNVKYLFKPYWNEALEIVEIGEFDENASRFASDSVLARSRYPYDEAIIKLCSGLSESKYVEYLDKAEIGFFDKDPYYDFTLDDPDPVVVRIGIRFVIEYDIGSGMLHYWLAKIGTQQTYLEHDFSKLIAQRVNCLNEYYSEWENGAESNVRSRAIIGGINTAEGGDEHFEY